MDGSYSAARSSLVMASGHAFATVSGMSAKSCYVYLLCECYSLPHCVLKFSHRFGDLYWTTTWHQLSLFSIDRPVIDLLWKMAHGVLYTVARLFSFGLNYGVSSFCRPAPEMPKHLFFFHALFLRVFSRGCNLSCFVLPPVVRPLLAIMFYLVLLLMNFVLSHMSSCICLMFASILFGMLVMIFVFMMSNQVLLLLLRELSPGSVSICHFCSEDSSPQDIGVTLVVSGVLVASLALSLVVA